MSSASSPTKYNSDHIYDPNFTQEINSKMRVPKRIKVDGSEDDMHMGYSQWNGNAKYSSMSMPKRINYDNSIEETVPLNAFSQWDASENTGLHEKVDMQVPDRIVLIGQEKTYGTTAPPREMLIENQVLPPDPGMIRVHTPPRVITLDQNYIDEYEQRRPRDEDSLDDDLFTLAKPNRQPPSSSRELVSHNSMTDTPVPINGTVRDEITHLRSQMAKQNRRIVALEYEAMNRNKRDKLLGILTVSYLLFKTLVWLARD